MSPHFPDPGHALKWPARDETPRVEAWGPDPVRVRATPGGVPLDDLSEAASVTAEVPVAAEVAL